MVITLPPGLGAWMLGQRWYAGKGGIPTLTSRGGWSLDTGQALIETLYVHDEQARGATLYQVPISHRREPLEGVDPLWQDERGFAYDAPHDPEYAMALLRLIDTESLVGDARGHHQPGARRVAITSTAVLRGEQSNTSIICSTSEGAPVMLKIFRAMHPGENPDVVIQSAISAAGSDLVPASVGFISGEWDDDAEPDGIARGQLAFAQDFLPGAEDGWRLALRAAAAGEDFGERARELGRATAEMHRTLGEVLETSDTSAADIDRFVAAMRSRAEMALAEASELEPLRARITAAIDAAAHATWPRLQRIHGDYHLGQVLAIGGTSATDPVRWVIIDFEGEPLRSMRERSAVDIALRDVAGMVRSFDYAAGAALRDATSELDTDPREWARRARESFLAGYSEIQPGTLERYSELVDAFELDKALYEAVYEARNRPGWLAIPVDAIRTLIST